MARRFIATGPPGSGKSTALALLTRAEVIPEAATDVNLEMLAEGISRPYLDSTFLPRIVLRQRQRRLAAKDELQLHDRSVYCTVALARFVGLAEPTELREELETCRGWFDRQVFFFEPFGFIRPTPVRRISYADALRFGAVHREVYQEHAFDLVSVPAEPPHQRAAFIAKLIS